MDKINTMVEISLNSDIKVIKETLSRMGIANKKQKILFPSCYLYQNFEHYYIVHFKEMFIITRENGYNNISEKDLERKNSIIFCLQNWDLIKVLNENEIIPHNEYVYVLSFAEKHKWTICHKFNVNNCEILH